MITSRRLRLFGHIARLSPSQDHQLALRAAINRLPADWQRPRGRLRRTWLHTVELDLGPTQAGHQLSVEVCTGPFKMASTCGDGYAH